MEFTIVDAAVAVIVLVSGALAYSRGFTRELFAIGGWVIAFIVAYYLAPAVEPLVREIPVVGQTLANSCLIAISAAFFLIVAIALVVLSIFTPLIANLVLDSVLAPIDRLLGFLFGIARGALLVAIRARRLPGLPGNLKRPRTPSAPRSYPLRRSSFPTGQPALSRNQAAASF